MGVVDHVAGVLEDCLAEGVASVGDVWVRAVAVSEEVVVAERMQEPLALDGCHGGTRG